MSESAPLLVLGGAGLAVSQRPPWLERLLGAPVPAPSIRAAGVSLALSPGERYALFGETGSGAAAIAALAAGLARPSAGTVRFGPRPDGGAAVRRMIFRDPGDSLNPVWRIGAIIGEGAARQMAAEAAMAEVGLDPALIAARPGALSPGEQQRVAIARALAARPDLLIAEEPTALLDVSEQARIWRLLSDLQARRGFALLYATRDLATARLMGERIGVLYGGRLVEEAAPAQLLHAPLHPYTQAALDAAPRLSPPEAQPEAPPAVPAAAARPPAAATGRGGGCAYASRCPWAADLCRQEAPRLAALGDGRRVACHAAAPRRRPA